MRRVQTCAAHLELKLLHPVPQVIILDVGVHLQIKNKDSCLQTSRKLCECGRQQKESSDAAQLVAMCMKPLSVLLRMWAQAGVKTIVSHQRGKHETVWCVVQDTLHKL